ncbi:unnamed protein product [Aphanomyces euteiches]|uniref:adenine phosphoribosyltransferase n=1 Tax=Aphanomyces euteiches TaxID=100861 RepID=A0A6G0XR76_9STRA|nr:hypothetical protein Ae201684_002230 [Aphanomyces euteiches]KAH9142655.1 hypothetical protein AeRB84_013302 [Aphanomyces euteiches]
MSVNPSLLDDPDELSKYLKTKIRTIPDFPKPGTDFWDVSTLLLDHEAFQITIDAFTKRYKDQNITHVVSCESRGFIFGAPLALAMKCAFVPVRRARKLPGHTIGLDYTSGYYHGRFEVHDDAIPPGSRVVIVDDLVASGNTLLVTCQLMKQLGAEVVECGCVVSSVSRVHRYSEAGHNILIHQPVKKVKSDGPNVFSLTSY